MKVVRAGGRQVAHQERLDLVRFHVDNVFQVLQCSGDNEKFFLGNCQTVTLEHLWEHYDIRYPGLVFQGNE